ncbi:MAG: hypothetical protein AAF968_12080 [Pseudomonadota bacterium]
MIDERIELISIDLAASIVAAAKRCAARYGLSLDRFVSIALTEKIGTTDAAGFFEHRCLGGDPSRAIAMLRSAPDVPPVKGDEIGS